MEFKKVDERQQSGSPLVSIIVITYNSSKYVLETLESARKQTYKNIELIISDDCSTDNTVNICRDWIGKNKNYFVRTELIIVEKNTGIPSNCNRGLFAAHGEWVKFIAGDDSLVDSCIYNFMEYIIKSKAKINALISNMTVYDQEFNDDKILYTTDKSEELLNHADITPSDQLALLVRGLGPSAPTSFFRKSLLESLGGFDEELPYEDGPIWIKITSNNYKLDFLNKVTVNYRLYDSVSNSQGNSAFFSRLYKQDYLIAKKVYKPFLTKIEFIALSCEYFIKEIFTNLNLQRRTKVRYFIYRFFTYPSQIIIRAYRKFVVLQITKNLRSKTNT